MASLFVACWKKVEHLVCIFQLVEMDGTHLISSGELESDLNVVYPANTRSTASHSTSRAPSAGASSSGPCVHEIDDDEEDEISSVAPKGLYV